MYNTHLDFHTFSDARSALCSASSVWLCAVVLGRSAEQWHTSLTACLSCSDHSCLPTLPTASSVQHPYGRPAAAARDLGY